MNVVKVDGKNQKHKVFLYALSTCAWCKMTKRFLKDSSIQYEYVDVDLCNDADRKKIHDDIRKRGADPSYPVIIVDDKKVINGFVKDRIKEALEI
jgi:glutaredoxin-like protein NrdH